jgi:hypothetical protein
MPVKHDIATMMAMSPIRMAAGSMFPTRAVHSRANLPVSDLDVRM